MRTIDDITADIHAAEDAVTEALEKIKTERAALKKQLSALGSEMGKIKRKHGTALRHLHSELGAAIVAQSD